MGILLILAQIVAIVLTYLAHAVTLNLWIVFLPGIAFLTIWGIALLTGCAFNIDSFKHIYVPRRRR
jgi:hypothetical protein